jgi:acetylornithine deacetylase/succinyl-diaminopimelate desuccinylase-like protein
MMQTARRLACAAVLLGLVPALAGAQADAPDLGARLMQDAAIKRALDAIRAAEPQTIEDQIRICEVEAPPFKEQKRGVLFAEMLKAAGLTNIRTDKEGNVLGELVGSQPRPHLLFAAHLDTVFPEGTDVRVKREGSLLRGPGIGDDCRGLAVLLAVARQMVKSGIKTPGTITFVGNVGEEGLGDLRGVKYLFNEGLKGRVDRFVSIDGTGLGITHIAVGSLRYRVTFKGPGGHSFGAFGLSNPIHALGRAVEKISNFEVPRDPKTTFNVGRIGGGTSVNSIAFESWFEVDMRSSDAAALQAIDVKFNRAVDEAVREEDARWNQRVLSVDKALVGNRPAGRTAGDAPIVRAAMSVTRALGLPVSLDEGSTDANYPMSLGIPAITIDGGGRGTDAHALSETFDTTDSWKGTERALLLAIALAQP